VELQDAYEWALEMNHEIEVQAALFKSTKGPARETKEKA
jgi:hypothetical protein